MEEQTEKKTLKERFKEVGRSIGNGFKKVGKVIVDNKELAVQIFVGVLGLSGAVIGLATVKEDHKETKAEQDLEKCHIYDYENYMDLYLNDEVTTKERLEIIEREKHGESRIDILQDMGKLI